MKLDIYMENRRVDVDADIKLAITYQFSDLSNPTTQTGDYSTTFTLKGTQRNNAIFGQIWRFDRATLLGGAVNTSVYFNASKRTPCVIYVNHEAFKHGYVKLNAIKCTNGTISYEVTFYSEVVNVLRTLKESKLRDLPFPNDLRHTLNAATVRQAWSEGGKEGIFYYLAYIMANNGLYDEFESGKWLTGSFDAPQVADILPSGIELDECAKREYRSYYQRPALRLRGLIELIAEQHGIELDPAFFNAGNPYFAKSVMAMPQYNIMEQQAQQVGAATYPMPNSITYTLNSRGGTVIPNYKADGDAGVFAASYSPTLNLANVLTWKLSPIIEFEYRITANLAVSVPVGTHLKWEDGTWVAPRVRIDTNIENNSITLNMESLGAMTRIAANTEFVVTGGNNNRIAVSRFDASKMYPGYSPGGAEYPQWIPAHGIVDTPVVNERYTSGTVRVFIEQSTGGQEFYLRKAASSSPTSYQVASFLFEFRPITKAPQNQNANPNTYYPASAGFAGSDFALNLSRAIRSGNAVDKRDIIDDEMTQGDFLINYAKLFGLIFYTDGAGTPHLVTRNTFFKEYRVIDWTDKIDHGKAVEQVPIPFDAKYMVLRYQGGDTFYERYYQHQYGVEFAEQRINTGFQFDENETNLIAETPFRNAVMSKEATRVLLTDGKGGMAFKFRRDNKTLPAFFDKENEQRVPSETKYNLLFDAGLEQLSPAQDIGSRIWLTDDVAAMLNDDIGGGQFCWIDTEHYVVQVIGGDKKHLLPETFYPKFTTLTRDGAFAWHLGYPEENYAGWTRSEFPESSTIFANFWRNYLTEVFDIDNRIMTVYVRLTNADIAQFSFANFVKIGHTLWHVNKIEQYDPLGNGTTKVELLRVSSLSAIESAYSNGQRDMSAVEPETYTVSLNLSNVTSSATGTTVQSGGIFRATLTAADGYQFSRVSVIMGDADITGRAFTSADNLSGDILIAGVTGDVTITAYAEAIPAPTYEVVLQLTNLTSSQDDATVKEGDTFAATIVANDGYTLGSMSIVMGGVDITSRTIGGQKVWVPSADNLSGDITIAGVTGDVTIVGAGAAVPVESYITINVYADDDRLTLTNVKGTKYTGMTKTAPTQVRLYYTNTSEAECTITADFNLPGNIVFVRGRPETSPIAAVTATLISVLTPSDYLAANNIEFNEYSDESEGAFIDGDNYYIMILSPVGAATDTGIRGLTAQQQVYAFNGKTSPTRLTSGDNERFTLPADCVALQIQPSDRGLAAEIYGIGKYEGNDNSLVAPAEPAANYGIEMIYVG